MKVIFLNVVFLDENILALKVDSKEEYAFLVNENKYVGELKYKVLSGKKSIKYALCYFTKIVINIKRILKNH